MDIWDLFAYLHISNECMHVLSVSMCSTYSTIHKYFYSYIEYWIIQITPESSLELLSPKETAPLKTVDSEVCSLYYYVAVKFSKSHFSML